MVDHGNWRVKFGIDVRHKLAWNVVQEFGCILDYGEALNVTEFASPPIRPRVS